MTAYYSWDSEPIIEQASAADLLERQVYAAQDNNDAMNELLQQPGVEPLTQALVTHYLRPAYSNGSPPQETLEPGTALHNRFLSLDLETVEDHTQRQILGLLQASVKTRQTHPTGPPMFDEQSLATKLVPLLIEKAETNETAAALMDITAGSLSVRPGRSDEDVQLRVAIIESAGSRLTTESIAPETTKPLARLTLLNSTLLLAHHHERNAYREQKLPNSGIVSLYSKLSELQVDILIHDVGMSPEVAMVSQQLFDRWETRIHTVMKNIDQLQKFNNTLASEPVRRLISEVLPTIQDPNNEFEDKILSVASDTTIFAPEEILSRLGDAILHPSYQALGLQLDSAYIQSRFDSKLLGAPEPMDALKAIESAVADSFVVQLVAYAKQMASKRDVDSILEMAIIHPEELKGIGHEIISSRLNRLYDEPSPASFTFLRSIMNGASKVEGSAFLLSACDAAIAENYAQASKLTDPLQLEHYNFRVEMIANDVSQILRGDPDIAAAYENFIGARPELSSKDQIRAMRVFKAAGKFAVPGITEIMTLEEIETRVIDTFVAALTGTQAKMNEASRARLIEAFGEITPLFSYTQKHMNKKEYRVALADLTQSVANGSYETWRRGDGSAEALEQLKEAGYFPENLTLEQYKTWIQDDISSTETELMSSSSEAARTIRAAVVQASVDISLLAPGYTVDAQSLSDIITTRNGLGKLKGLLQKEAGASGGDPITAEKVQIIMDQLGELKDSREIADVMGGLERGMDPREVIRYVEAVKERMEQMRLIIRLANLSPEEIMAGSLLAEVDAVGRKKPQQKLNVLVKQLAESLPPELKFIPEVVGSLLVNFNLETQGSQKLTAEDTIDPKITLEIGETPQRSCQHYETGGFNEGLIGYFDPEVKITVVKNDKGGIIARTITRLMQDDDGNPALYTEPIYKSIASSKIEQLIHDHLTAKSEAMGISLYGFNAPKTGKSLTIRKLKMPATYSDSSGGLNRDKLSIML